MLTFAGQLGYMGMNEYGVAQFANGLCDYEWRLGLPHYPLKRVMLETRTVDECVDLLTQFQPCSAANVVLCDGQGRIADVEVRPHGVARFRDEHPDRILHTNHYLTPELSAYGTDYPDSLPRLDRFRALVELNWGRITVDTMKDILADHKGDPAAICRHGAMGRYSIIGYIAEPAKELFHVRRGHGCLGTWTAYKV
jgi:isopenicillin-N N-acyltransferase-like protein